jgi:micrococcal nuclease
VYLQYDPVAGERGYYGRLLAYVILENETNFNAHLLEEGYARAYTSAECEYLETFIALEEDAQEKGRGVWSEATYATKEGVQIDTVNPFEEYVVITNYTEEDLDMTGWTLEDKAGGVFSFPAGFTLAPGQSVRIHTFAGEDTQSSLYWGSTENIWNNSSDEAYLYDKVHSKVDEFIY